MKFSSKSPKRMLRGQLVYDEESGLLLGTGVVFLVLVTSALLLVLITVHLITVLHLLPASERSMPKPMLSPGQPAKELPLKEQPSTPPFPPVNPAPKSLRLLALNGLFSSRNTGI
jgi:hypothetical protein